MKNPMKRLRHPAAPRPLNRHEAEASTRGKVVPHRLRDNSAWWLNVETGELAPRDWGPALDLCWYRNLRP